MMIKVVESGREWNKVVDMFATLWNNCQLKAGDCVRCSWENTTTQWMQRAD